jgi:hypothetical protein
MIAHANRGGTVGALAVAAGLPLALALLLAPGRAWAHGEPQENRLYLSGGLQVLAPLSPAFDAAVDPSLGTTLEAGYLIGFGPDRGAGHFALAPMVALRLYDLNDGFIGTAHSTYAATLSTGVKAGFAGRGAFLYGLADVGLSGTHFVVCNVKRCTSLSEPDFVTHLGGGIDFSVSRHVALGASVAVPVLYSRDGRGIDETETGIESTVYGKFLFPAPGRKLDVAVTMPSVEVHETR